MLRSVIPLVVLTVIAAHSHAVTTQDGPIFTIDKGVDFTLGNAGASSYLFSWTDPGGGASFTNEVDPTLILTAGETYTFVRSSGSHPFIIMDESAEAFITGTDGAYQRTTTNGGLLDAATLEPIADFTADPAPSGDVITWTPTIGEYWYTCRVTGHLGMTGRILVVPVPEPTSLGLMGLSGSALCRRWRF